jgi:hypothetical protein
MKFSKYFFSFTQSIDRTSFGESKFSRDFTAASHFDVSQSKIAVMHSTRLNVFSSSFSLSRHHQTINLNL